MLVLLLVGAFVCGVFGDECSVVPESECCEQIWSRNCPQPQCYGPILQNCPERKALVFGRANGDGARDLRRSPPRAPEPKCGTAEQNYAPCTSKSVANKLFASCCELYVPSECRSLCRYETDQSRAKELLSHWLSDGKCPFKYLSSILYCAAANRDNRACCQDLELNAPQLMVGSRCLRFCDPTGTAIGRITKEDVTCLFNWNVLMYCAHSGIREM